VLKLNGLNPANHSLVVEVKDVAPTFELTLTHFSCLLSISKSCKMSFGFSAGDIATAIVLIANIAQALSSASGASAEYREAVAFLKKLQRTLELLHTLSALSAYPAYSEEIRMMTCDIKGPIEEFLWAVEKYEPSLGVDAKKGHYRNIPRKLEWHFRMSKDVERLREKVGAHLLLIDKLLQRLTM
jgi:hypothetical protein